MEEPTRNPLEQVFEAPEEQPARSHEKNEQELLSLLERYATFTKPPVLYPLTGPSGRPAHGVIFLDEKSMADVKLRWR